MKILSLVFFSIVFSSAANAMNLYLLSSHKNADLKGIFELYVDLDSLKEIHPGLFEIVTVINVPSLTREEGNIVISHSRSVKKHNTIDCNVNGVVKWDAKEYAKPNANGALIQRYGAVKNNDSVALSNYSFNRQSTEFVCADNNLQSYKGKALNQLATALSANRYEARHFDSILDASFYYKGEVTLIVEFESAVEGRIGFIKTSPNLALPEDIAKMVYIKGFDAKLEMNGWHKFKNDAQVFVKNINGRKRYIVVWFAPDATKKITSIVSFY